MAKIFNNFAIEYYFVQLGFNLSNRVTDTHESSSILINSRKCMRSYTKNVVKVQLDEMVD